MASSFRSWRRVGRSDSSTCHAEQRPLAFGRKGGSPPARPHQRYLGRFPFLGIRGGWRELLGERIGVLDCGFVDAPHLLQEERIAGVQHLLLQRCPLTGSNLGVVARCRRFVLTCTVVERRLAKEPVLNGRLVCLLSIRTERFLLCLTHQLAKGRDKRALGVAELLAHGLHGSVEGAVRRFHELVTTEHGQHFLLRGQVQVLALLDGFLYGRSIASGRGVRSIDPTERRRRQAQYPNALGIDRPAVGRHVLGVGVLEDEVRGLGVGEPLLQRVHISGKRCGVEDLVRQRRVRDIKEVVDARRSELRRLQESGSREEGLAVSCALRDKLHACKGTAPEKAHTNLGDAAPDLFKVCLDGPGERLQRGRAPHVIADHEEQQRLRSGTGTAVAQTKRSASEGVQQNVTRSPFTLSRTCRHYKEGGIPVLAKELQVELKHGLEKTVVRRIPAANVLEPQIDDEDFRQGERKERGLALKALLEAWVSSGMYGTF